MAVEGEPILILLVEDEPAHAEAFVRAFQSEGRNDVVKVVGTLREYRDLVAAGPPGIAVVDMVLSDGRGVDVLVSPPEAGLFPVVVLTSFGNERTAVEAMRAGALDYVVKSPTAFAEMPHTVARVLREWDLLREGQRTQAALRASEARFRGMAEQLADVLYTTDAQGVITFVSPSARAVFGWDPEEMTGRHFQEFLVEDQVPRVLAAFGAAEESGARLPDLELTIERKDGSAFFAELTGAPIVSGTGQAGFLGVIRDVSERKRAETVLLEAFSHAQAANVAKSQFLATMSHEIRTPMNGVIGFTGLLLETALSEDQRQYAEIVRSSGQALLDLINDILDYSKVEAGRLELEELDFDLRTTLDDFSDLLALRAQEKGLEFACGIAPDVPTLLKGDPGRLRQILVNLAGNAVKFTASGGVSVRVSLESETEDSATLRFQVRDTGIGIPKDKLGLLFGAFQQVDSSTSRNYGGTGLGLAIARRLAELMGGAAGVESAEGEGTTFWFTAVLGRQDASARAPQAPPTTDLRGHRVLIVDDNAELRDIVCLMLAGWGVRATEAASGEAALALLREASTARDPFRLAILDMRMPEMGGEDLARAIAASPELRETRLVLMTTLARRGDASRMKDAGFSAYLPKPIKQSELRDCLSAVFGAGAEWEEDAPPLDARHSERQSQRARFRILLAEDNVTNQKVALGILGKLGFRADAVANGREVVEALGTLPYDLVFMDVQMPVLDGFEATRLIRSGESQALNPNVPVIAMTALADQDDRARCLDAGMNDCLSKPISAQAVAAVIERWLGLGE